MILAADALSRTTPGSGLFRGLPSAGPGSASCGCPSPG
jgi:hypothetical protein